MPIKDIAGQRFGRLIVLNPDGFKSNGKTRVRAWLCRCDCGGTKTIASTALRRGLTKSCGCLLNEWRTSAHKHGHARKKKYSKEYTTYYGMLARCFNSKNKEYKRYGGSGITVCDQWLGTNGFANFLQDMGTAPSSKHTIDRINGDCNYEPSKCRWATAVEQVRNRRNTKIYQGKSLAEWATETGINYYTLWSRWSAGNRGDKLLRAVEKRE